MKVQAVRWPYAYARAVYVPFAEASDDEGSLRHDVRSPPVLASVQATLVGVEAGQDVPRTAAPEWVLYIVQHKSSAPCTNDALCIAAHFDHGSSCSSLRLFGVRAILWRLAHVCRRGGLPTWGFEVGKTAGVVRARAQLLHTEDASWASQLLYLAP